MISRRTFFGKAAKGIGVSLLMPGLHGCERKPELNASVLGPNAALGHRLHTMDFPAASETMSVEVVIVGGGVSGLSAARFLKKYTDDFLLLELEHSPGGNAVGGANSISAFPWGAHYLPLPGKNDLELIEFLRECDVITGFTNGRAVFNEYFLCHDPKERLYINHFWQDSIIPHEGVSVADREEIHRFLSLMQEYKHQRGNDGKPAFSIPLELSSRDENFLRLDRFTADQFLKDNNFKSQYLRWYVNYCCADDYGSRMEQTSAWAMIHYFAARLSDAANAPSDAVLTWPEGNFWLVRQLQKGLENQVYPSAMAFSLSVVKDKVEILAFDAARNISKKIVANKVIMATPQYINKRILAGIERKINYDSFQYAPWMVANMIVSGSLNDRRGEQLCWDNVIYGGESLGYVNAMHQQLGFEETQRRVITYYKPLIGGDAVTSRRQAHSKKGSDWRSEIVRDLSMAHRNIDNHIEEMAVWIWGHGMIRPSPGFVWGKDRLDATNTIGNKIWFAHSDVSGISIFEEAFYQGHKAAKSVLGV